jgi:deazaflavin-dependent oxidoreductase (nitroreductase family)
MTEDEQHRELLEQSSTLALITRGRRSGRPHRVLLWFAYREGTVYLMAHARTHGQGTDWYRNARAHPTVTVEADGCRWIGRAEPLPEAMLPTVMQWFAEKYGSAAVRAWYEGTPRLPIRITFDR